MKSKHLIIVGSGLGVLYLSRLLPDDFTISIYTSGNHSDANSFMAKGGVAFPLNHNDLESHISDTFIAGDKHGNIEVIRDIITSAPQILDSLKQMNIVFDDHYALEGGHSVSRVRHLEDETGFKLSSAVLEQVKQKKNVNFYTYHQTLDIITSNNRAIGIKVFDSLTGKINLIYGDAIVIATGGVSGLYLHHTNSVYVRGEGHAMAARAGATMSDMEFIQFHPTTLFDDSLKPHYLITEALRGAGAVLEDFNGNQFMNAIHPLGSLAPRDIVSQSISKVMDEQSLPHVWLNFVNVSESERRLRFPSLNSLLEKYEHLKLPVVPAAHYTCGGIAASTEGLTSVTNLYAIGECACTGFHGANRLASNSLLELLVMGYKLSIKLSEFITSNAFDIVAWESFDAESLLPTADYARLNNEIKHVLWNNFGIIRNKTDMEFGIGRLKAFQHEIHAYMMPGITDPNLSALQNRVETALMIANAAFARSETKGSHYINQSKAINA